MTFMIKLQVSVKMQKVKWKLTSCASHHFSQTKDDPVFVERCTSCQETVICSALQKRLQTSVIDLARTVDNMQRHELPGA